MELLIFRALWGMTGPFEAQLNQIAQAGYSGVEGFLGGSDLSPSRFSSMVAAHNLKLIMAAQVDSQAQLEATVNKLAEYQPIKIGLHSGRDSMSRDAGCAYFEEALRLEQQLGIPIAHETHRGRMFFTPWDTAFYLKRFDNLHIVADYSHWVNVCERLPDDQREALTLANQRAIHIHGRVGYEEGPQVSDPSAPEYSMYLEWHERQWSEILENRHRAGDTIATFTPEYGPPGYLHTLPHTNVPVADLWKVCLWAAERARQKLSPVVEGKSPRGQR